MAASRCQALSWKPTGRCFESKMAPSVIWGIDFSCSFLSLARCFPLELGSLSAPSAGCLLLRSTLPASLPRLSRTSLSRHDRRRALGVHSGAKGTTEEAVQLREAGKWTTEKALSRTKINPDPEYRPELHVSVSILTIPLLCLGHPNSWPLLLLAPGILRRPGLPARRSQISRPGATYTCSSAQLPRPTDRDG